MKKTVVLSDEMLNAFIDDELEGADRERVILLETRHHEVANAISEKRRIKFLVKTARESGPETTPIRIKSGQSNYRLWTAVASILVIVATSLSVFLPLNDKVPFIEHSVVNYSSKSSYPDSTSLLHAVHNQKHLKLVFHLNSIDSKTAKKLFSEIATILHKAKQYGQIPQVEVIATGTGTQLLTTASKANLNKQIQWIHEHSPEVTFLVCGTSLKKIQKTSPVELTLLQETMLVASGKDWIKKRKHQGWSYIKI